MLGTSPLPQPDALFEPKEYRRYLPEARARQRAARGVRQSMPILHEYVRRLPVYLFARCPVCGDPVGEPVDTFSLNGLGWRDSGLGKGWAWRLEPAAEAVYRCPHTRIVSFFVNLHGKEPDDLFPDQRIHAGPEVPSLMTFPMSAPDAQAVIHELPVARFDDLEPRPHYSAYFVTYFTERRESFIEAIRDWDIQHGMVDYRAVDYDLAAWVERGRLSWLATEDPDLPLMRGGEGEFPYGDIDGDTYSLRVITAKADEAPRRGVLGRLLGVARRGAS